MAHPNIATIHELREADGVHFIVMEYVEGATLKRQITSGPLESSELIRLAIQIAHGLDAAHGAGVIHGDIKSSNIMVTPRGHAKVLDFGLATRTVRDRGRAGDSAAVMGTAPYMSPNRRSENRSIDDRIFSASAWCCTKWRRGACPSPGPRCTTRSTGRE